MTRRYARSQPAFLADVDRWSQGLAAAWARMGKTRADRLRWLVHFVERDLTMLREGEWHDLIADVYAFPLSEGYQPAAHSGEPQPVGLSREDIKALRCELKDGIEKVLCGPGWMIPLPSAKRYIIQRRRTRTIETGYEGDVRSCILMTAFDLLQSEGARVRVCIECEKLFVAVKRQAYCTPKCSQRARTRRFRGPHRKRPPIGGPATQPKPSQLFLEQSPRQTRSTKAH